MGYVELFKNHKYLLGHFQPNGIFIEEWNKKFPTFFKSKVEKEVLDSIPNLGYSENDNEYIVWDKEVYETEKIEVPVYVKMFGDYRCTGKTYIFEVPTRQALDAANKIADILVDQMELEKYRPSINKLQQLLETFNGICYVSTFDILNISLICQISGKEILWSRRNEYIIGDSSMVTSLDLMYVFRIS